MKSWIPYRDAIPTCRDGIPNHYLHCLLFFFCFSFFTLSVFPKSSPLDSLIRIVESDSITLTDTARIDILLHLSDELSYSDPWKGMVYALMAKDLAKKINDPHRFTRAYNEISWSYYISGDVDKALNYARQSLEICRKTNDSTGMLSLLGTMGNLIKEKGDFSGALKYYSDAFRIAEVMNNKKGMARNEGSIAVIYHEQGNYPAAMENYLKSLATFEKLLAVAVTSTNVDEIRGLKRSIATRLGNIGILYLEQDEREKALDCYNRSLKIAEELNDHRQISAMLGNLGALHHEMKQLSAALDYYQKSLAIAVEQGNRGEMEIRWCNIGNVYKDLEQYGKAIENYLKTVISCKQTGEKKIAIYALGNLGSVYKLLGHYHVAGVHLSQAHDLAKQLGLRNEERGIHSFFYELYAEQGNWKNAYSHYDKYISLRDSLFNIDRQKEIVRKEMRFLFEKEQERANLVREKELTLASSQNRRQKLAIQFSAAGGVLLVLLAAVTFYAYAQKRKSNRILAGKNEKLREAYTIIEDKNTAITDSITYAKRIQEAMLPEKSIINTFLSAGRGDRDDRLFILYLPRDIVSGDFYWFHQVDSRGVLTVADCTGHGVPGAFMSMTGNDLLNDIVAARGITHPDEILNQLDLGVRKALRQQETRNNDGMDISLITIDKKAKTLEYAGSKNPLICFRNNEPTIIPADKFGIGGRDPEDYDKKFQLHRIVIDDPAVAYLISDGYQDQIGGPKNKKFMMKNLLALLAEIHTLSMPEQYKIIQQRLERWKGNGDQLDDITVIGIALT